MKINLCTTIAIAEDTTGRGKYHKCLAALLRNFGFDVVESTFRIKDANLYIGTPDRLNGYMGGNAIRIIHSEANELSNMSNGGIIYVAEHLRRKRNYKCIDWFIWRPMVSYPAHHEKRQFRGVIGQINLNPRKGGNTFYEIAAAMPEYKFIGIKGWGRQIIKSLPNVELIDYRPDLTEFYKAVDILLIPSESEGLPTVALEAHRFGLPVIGSVIPGNIEAGVMCCVDYPSTIRQVVKDYDLCHRQAIANDSQPDPTGFINWLKNYL